MLCTSLALVWNGYSRTETTQAEKEKAVAYLETTKKGVLEATKGLSEAQWNFKAAPDKWSVAQCAEHIAGRGGFHSRNDRRERHEKRRRRLTVILRSSTPA